jgi:hypothetical protein
MQTWRRSDFPFFGKGKPDSDQTSLFSEKANSAAIRLPFFRKIQTWRRSDFPFFGKGKPGGDQTFLFSEKANLAAIGLPFFLIPSKTLSQVIVQLPPISLIVITTFDNI